MKLILVLASWLIPAFNFLVSQYSKEALRKALKKRDIEPNNPVGMKRWKLASNCGAAVFVAALAFMEWYTVRLFWSAGDTFTVTTIEVIASYVAFNQVRNFFFWIQEIGRLDSVEMNDRAAKGYHARPTPLVPDGSGGTAQEESALANRDVVEPGALRGGYGE